jgi:hypothetical protein
LHELDPSIPKFVPGDALLKFMVFYYIGLLPFVSLEPYEVFALPWMTRDYLAMKLKQGRD